MTSMTSAAVASVVVAFFLTPVARSLAVRFGMFDIPNERSSHKTPTPRGGGVAVVVAVIVGCLLGGVLGGRWVRWSLGVALATGALGLTDDYRPIDSRLRLFVQSLAAIFLTLGVGMNLRTIGMAGVGSVDLGAAAWLVTAFWLVGFTNAFNFMDGINGIAATHAIVSGAFLALLGVLAGDPAVTVISACVAGSALGFLPWNFPRATVFMGDVGSAFYGVLLATLVVRLERLGIPIVAAMLPLLPFLFDTTLTLIRRIAARERLLSAHRTHLYQRLTAMGWSHARVTLLWSALAVGSGAGALLYALREDSVRVGVVIAVTSVHVALAAWILAASRRQV